MKQRKKIYNDFVQVARLEGLNISFSYVELKKDPLLLAKAKNKLGTLFIEYIDGSVRPFGAFQTISLSKGYESPDLKEKEIRQVYVSYGFHETNIDLISTFLNDCEELKLLFSL